MDEKRLAETEEWANDHVPRCYGCDGIARVIVPGTSRPLCEACAPNVPGAVLPLVSVYATTLDLVAEVRRLTAALATVTTERDALSAEVDRLTLACSVPGLITGMVRKILGAVDGEATPTAAQRVVRERDNARADLARLRAEHAAALATARREGAEEVMALSDPWPLHDVLAKLTEASRALLGRYNYDGHGWELILAACESADAIIARIHTRARALPLDAPGGGS